LRYISLLIKGSFAFFALSIYSVEYEKLDSLISEELPGSFTAAYIHGKFDQSLDVLNYASKLESTKPEKASSDTYFFSYRWNKLKLGIENTNSSGKVIRPTQPNEIETNVGYQSFHATYSVYSSKKYSFNLGLIIEEEDQDPVLIDCYSFGETIVGGSCEGAKLRLLDGEVYRNTGELIYKPVLTTSGHSDSKGIYLRITSKLLNKIDFIHTLTYKSSVIKQNFESDILNSTDSFMRGLSVDGKNAGNLLDSFKEELPQLTPWKDHTFKYSVGNFYPINKKIAFSSAYTFIKVKRIDFIKNPNKDDFTENHLIDLSLFYRLQQNTLFFLKISASTNYLLGESPLAYNRKSNHLFDHPYGQVYAGLLFNF